MLCSEHELIQLLLSVRGAQPITFTARTDAGVRAKDKNKVPNPHARPIWKIATVNAMVNFWYDRGVLRRLKAEGKSFDSFLRGSSWHLPVLVGNRLTPLCKAKNEKIRDMYLRVMYRSTIGDPAFHDAEGKLLKFEDVAPFLPPRSEYANQGLVCPLIFKTYHVSGIRSLTLKGLNYQIAE